MHHAPATSRKARRYAATTAAAKQIDEGGAGRGKNRGNAWPELEPGRPEALIPWTDRRELPSAGTL